MFFYGVARALQAVAPQRWVDFFLRRRCILSRLRRYKNVGPGTVDTFDIFACRDTRSRVRGRLEYRVLVRDHTLCMLKNIKVIFFLMIGKSHKNIQSIKYDVGC